MKKAVKITILLLALLGFTAACFAQTSDFRSNTLKGVAQPVGLYYAAPRVINIVNDTTTVLFVKFYDQVTQPFSTSVPVLTIMVPASSSVTYNISNTLFFKNSMWIRAGKGVLDADTTWNKWKSFPPIVEITY